MDLNYDDYEGDVALEVEDRESLPGARLEWFKMTKGQNQLCALLYFHPVDATARKAFVAQEKKAGRVATLDDLKKAADKALEERATALGKPVEQLSRVEKLDLSRVQFRTCRAHYHVDIGFTVTRLGLDGPEADAVWKALPEPSQHFSTLLLLYPTTHEGKLDLEATRAGRWKLMPWRFGRATYGEIFSLNDGLKANGLSLAEQDIRLECKDAKFQKLKVAFVGKAAWRSSESFKQKVLSAAVEQYDGLVPFRSMSTATLREKLGIAAKEPNVVASEDLSGLLDSI
jgi:hypothetical protein